MTILDKEKLFRASDLIVDNMKKEMEACIKNNYDQCDPTKEKTRSYSRLLGQLNNNKTSIISEQANKVLAILADNRKSFFDVHTEVLTKNPSLEVVAYLVKSIADLKCYDDKYTFHFDEKNPFNSGFCSNQAYDEPEPKIVVSPEEFLRELFTLLVPPDVANSIFDPDEDQDHM